jgi:hypothetical protein
MLETIEFKNSKNISLVFKKKWSDEYNVPIYWTAVKRFNLDFTPDFSKILIAVDRHYELFINDTLFVRQRNFYNGDSYIFAQKWSDEITPLLKAGTNKIAVVIRSDPWENKNHRCFTPFVNVEMDIKSADNSFTVVSDSSWQVSLINNWRSFIAMGGCGTIHFEQIKLVEDRDSVLSGFTEKLQYKNAIEIIQSDKMPAVYEWTESPVSKNRYIMKTPVYSGNCKIIKQAVELEMPRKGKGSSSDEVKAFATEFNDKGRRVIKFATTNLYHHSILVNDKEVYSYNGYTPDNTQTWSYIEEAGEFVTRPGINKLQIKIKDNPDIHGEYRFNVGCPLIMEQLNVCWKNIELSSSEAISGMIKTDNENNIFIGDNIRVNSARSLSFITFDTGKVVSGRISLNIKANDCGIIYLAFGFKHSNGVLDNERIGLKSVDLLKVPKGDSSYTSFDLRTFRYLSLVFENFQDEVSFSNLKVEEDVYLSIDNCSFNCSEQTLNRVWNASVLNTLLCGDEQFVDNPEREHAQWMDGLLYISTSGYYLSGENVQRKTKKILEEFMISQQPDGQLPGYTPGSWFPRVPLQCHMALFIITCYEYFMNTGDYAFAKKLFTSIKKILKFWSKFVLNGLITDLHTVFVDWGSHIYSYAKQPSGNTKESSGIATGALTTMNAYYLGALRKSAEIAEYLGLDRDSREFTEKAEALRTVMIEKMFDRESGVFRDGYNNAEAENNISQTANALAVLFGGAPEGMEGNIMRNVFGDSTDLDIIPANSFFTLQTCSAMFESGCEDIAINWLKNKFEMMLDKGPGTLWETFDDYSSRCQSSGAAPLMLFSKYLAGVYPAVPGYEKIGINPRTSDLKYLKAELDTPAGKIKLNWKKTGSKLKYNLEIPENLKDKDIICDKNIKLKVDTISNI